MFEKIRQTFRDALQSATQPEDRRAVVAEMKATLVQARMGVDDLRGGVARTRARLAAEQRELETVRRRRGLAQGINDHETVAVAERYERQHAERLEVLGRKLEAEERELALAESEVSEMLAEFKGAATGAAPTASGTGAPSSAAGAGGDQLDTADDPERDPLADSLDRLGRDRVRAERDAAAEEQLAALKRRMGR